MCQNWFIHSCVSSFPNNKIDLCAFIAKLKLSSISGYFTLCLLGSYASGIHTIKLSHKTNNQYNSLFYKSRKVLFYVSLSTFCFFWLFAVIYLSFGEKACIMPRDTPMMKKVSLCIIAVIAAISLSEA